MARKLLGGAGKEPRLQRVLLIIGSAIALTASASEPTPSALADEAVAQNPHIDALIAREAALRESASVAGAWPDPMLSVEYSNVPVQTWSLSGHPMAGVQVRAQQTLRPPGWSGARRSVAARTADSARWDVAEAELQLRAAVEQAWWRLVQTRMLRSVTVDHVARTEELLEAARARYETGTVGQHAVLRLTVLRDRLTDDVRDFDRTERELEAALSAALGRRAGDHFDTPVAVDPLPPPEDRDWPALAESHRPAVARADSDRERAEAAIRLAGLDALPDPSVWAGYRVRTVETPSDAGADLVAVGIGLPIPSGSLRRSNGERRSALQRAAAARATRQSVLDGVSADMQATLARWGRASSKVDAYEETLIPGARATLATTQAEFAVGRADFASLFEAEVALLDLERARIVAAVDTHLQRAVATALLGVSPTGGSE